MKNVFALENHARSLSKAISITDWAVVVTFLTHCCIFIKRNASFIQAWQALLLSCKSTASVPTLKNIIACLVHKFDTRLLSAHISKSWLDRWRSSFNFWVAVSAFTCLFMIFKFFASFSDVIWLCLALTTEIFLTFLASYSEFAHMDSCFFRDRLSNFIFNFKINFSRNNLHYILTATGH